MKKKAKAVMLPTKDETNIVLSNNKPTLGFKGVHKLVNPEKLIYQHLYIISDDEIKAGDWFFDIVDSHIQQLKFTPKTDIGSGSSRFKIIATTDKSLKLKDKCDCSESEAIYCGESQAVGKCQQNLPSPSQEFIQEYCKRNGEIEDVEVECGYYCTYCGEENCDNLRCKGYEDEFRYDVNSDNTINIYIPEEEKLYSKQDIIYQLYRYWTNTHGEGYSNSKMINWIKENL